MERIWDSVRSNGHLGKLKRDGSVSITSYNAETLWVLVQIEAEVLVSCRPRAALSKPSRLVFCISFRPDLRPPLPSDQALLYCHPRWPTLVAHAYRDPRSWDQSSDGIELSVSNISTLQLHSCIL